jgi:catalase (peroxidase I)
MQPLQGDPTCQKYGNKLSWAGLIYVNPEGPGGKPESDDLDRFDLP